jgi:hypothetical protein
MSSKSILLTLTLGSVLLGGVAATDEIVSQFNLNTATSLWKH